MKEKKSILHLDDSRFALKIFKKLLTDSGKLYQASEIEEALEILNLHKIDVILCDLNLGADSGFDFIRSIRQKPALKQIPVILLTAHLNGNILIQAQKLKIEDVVLKTDSAKKLKTAIRNQLKHAEIVLPKANSIEINCLQWNRDETYFEFCPDAQKLIQGKSPEEVHIEMGEYLKKLYKKDLLKIDILPLQIHPIQQVIPLN